VTPIFRHHTLFIGRLALLLARIWSPFRQRPSFFFFYNPSLLPPYRARFTPTPTLPSLHICDVGLTKAPRNYGQWISSLLGGILFSSSSGWTLLLALLQPLTSPIPFIFYPMTGARAGFGRIPVPRKLFYSTDYLFPKFLHCTASPLTPRRESSVD